LPDKIGKALGVERIVRQKVEPLPFHLAAVAAIKAPHLQLQEYPRVRTGQIAHTADLAVVPAHLDATTHPHTVFLSCALSDHRKSRARSVPTENQETNTYPKAGDGVSMLVPSIIDAKYRPAKMQNPLAIPRFVEPYP